MGNRLQEIVTLVEQQGFLSVKELSQEIRRFGSDNPA